MRKMKSLPTALAASLLLGFGGAAYAGYYTSTITSGLNLYEDQSREAYVDVNENGLFDASDVLLGLARIDNNTTSGSPVSLNNTTYAVFSQQVDKIVGDVVYFKPTTEAGLKLSDMIGAAAGASDMFAVFSTPTSAGYGVDLIGTSPGDVTGVGGITLKDYIQYIVNGGTLDMIMGMVDSPFCANSPANGGDGDCFQARTNRASFAGGANGQFIGLEATVGVAAFIAGLEVTTDPAGWTISDNTTGGAYFDGPITSVNEFAINRGTAAGYSGQQNEAEWINAGEYTSLRQCTPLNGQGAPDLSQAAVDCGFTDNVAFGFRAVAVPEPATLGLLGLSLLGLASVRRRRS